MRGAAPLPDLFGGIAAPAPAREAPAPPPAPEPRSVQGLTTAQALHQARGALDPLVTMLARMPLSPCPAADKAIKRGLAALGDAMVALDDAMSAHTRKVSQ